MGGDGVEENRVPGSPQQRMLAPRESISHKMLIHNMVVRREEGRKDPRDSCLSKREAELQAKVRNQQETIQRIPISSNKVGGVSSHHWVCYTCQHRTNVKSKWHKL